MNSSKCDDLDYIPFLIATQKIFTCTEAKDDNPQPQYPRSRCLSPPAKKTAFRPKSVVQEAQTLVDKKKGLLVLDDTP